MSDIFRSRRQGWILSIVIVLALAAGPLVSSPNALAGEGSADEPRQVGGKLLPPELIKKVDPVYPLQARHSHISGDVIVEAVVDTDGRVENAHVVRSIPLLDAAAVEAVKQWRYKPATVDGRPVRVSFGVTVTFHGDHTGATPGLDSPSAAGDNVLETTGDLQPPVLVSKVAPVYPEQARQALAQGDVVINAIIDADGNVVSAEVVGHQHLTDRGSISLLDEAAVSAVKQWKYRPATKAGRPVKIMLTLTINFAL